jgi:outer membrane protein TolC
MKYIFSFLFLLLLVANSTNAQSTDTLFLNIEQTTQMAVANNPDLRRVQLDETLLERQIATAKTSIFPKLNGSAGFTDNFSLPQQLLPGEVFGQEGLIPVQFGVKYGLNAGVELSQLVYSREYFTNIKKLESVRSTYRLQTLSSMEDLVFNVVQLYIQYQITQEQKEILNANLERITKLVDISQAQFENGIIKKLDVDQLKVNRTNLATEISNANIGLEQQLNLLKFYLDIPQSQPVRLTENLNTTENYPLSQELLLQQNINYQLLQEQVKVTEMDKDVIKSAYYPTVSAFAQYNYTGQANEFNFKSDNYSGFFAGLWGLNVSVPIFDGFNAKRRLEENAVQLEQLRLQEKQLVNAANLEFNNATIKIKQNETLVQTQLENMKLAQELYDITKLSYQEGVAPLTELLNAETSLREAQSNYLTASLNFKLAELEHIRVSGQLAQLIQNQSN